MINLSVKYLGLDLKNPIVVSSSGLTDTSDKIKELAELGVGAVVLKSLFEEQINYETNNLLEYEDHTEAADYIRFYARENALNDYIKLIEESKSKTNIPIIASINCVTASDWTGYARTIEKSGADAIELNINILPIDMEESSLYEHRYIEIVKKIKDTVAIPIAVKIGPHFTNPIRLVNSLYASGADAVVLFNRFYEPDIDIENMKMTVAPILSTPIEVRQSLRWTSLITSKLKNIQVSASTGIHSSEAAIKLLLAGASSVQVCSVLYQNGTDYIKDILSGIEGWMEKHGLESVEDFIGNMNVKHIHDPAFYERSQFMKYFSNYKQ